MNFGGAPATVPVEGGAPQVVLATHAAAELRAGAVELPPLAGALVRR
jgi:hypothetical protein